MRLSHALWCIPVVVVCAACADDPIAPLEQRGVSATYTSCTGGLDTKVARKAQTDASLSIGTLPGVTVWATYSGGGLPFNLTQMMNFGPGTNLWSLPCLETANSSYRLTAAEPEDSIPAPPEVDPSWWTTLSPRERRVLIKFAQAYMALNPEGYKTVGQVIAERFEPVIPTIKVRSKVRALDYYGASREAELLSGGIYACNLYRQYQSDPYSKILGSELLDFASSLTAAFGEAQFASRPLTAVLFGKNGAYGAALAAANPHTDCGTMVFRAVGSSITVADPYGGSTPPELDR